MRLTQIRDFLAVVECGSLRAAARKLGVAQPTVSKSVRDLENELHVQLVGRSSLGVALTPAGRKFHERAQAAAAELRKAADEASQTSQVGAGSVTFSMGPVGVIAILPEAMVRFRSQFPLARIRVMEGFGHVMLPEVRSGVLDFAFGQKSAKGMDASIRFRPLFESELVICARRGHPLRRAGTLKQLAKAEWMANGNAFEPGAALERVFLAAGLEPPRPAVTCTNHSTAMSLLAQSDMVSLTQRLIIERPPASLMLQEIKVAEPLPTVTVGLFARADSPLTRPAAAMVRHIVAVARQIGRP